MADEKPNSFPSTPPWDFVFITAVDPRILVVASVDDEDVTLLDFHFTEIISGV